MVPAAMIHYDSRPNKPLAQPSQNEGSHRMALFKQRISTECFFLQLQGFPRGSLAAPSPHPYPQQLLKSLPGRLLRDSQHPQAAPLHVYVTALTTCSLAADSRSGLGSRVPLSDCRPRSPGPSNFWRAPTAQGRPRALRKRASCAQPPQRSPPCWHLLHVWWCWVPPG